MKNTIKLKKYVDIIEEYQATDATVTPGALLELTSDNLVKAHATNGGLALPMFALEDELQGKGIADNYAANDKIQVWVASRGEVVYALVADSEDIATGDFVASAGNGKIKVANDSNGDAVIGVALSDLDMTDSNDAVIGRVAIRIL